MVEYEHGLPKRRIEKGMCFDGILISDTFPCRLEFDQDDIPDLTAEVYLQDIHSISSLLKMYFRELPNPLLTYQLYNKFSVSTS